MTHQLPSHYVSNFSNERLSTIALALLEQCYETEDDLQSVYDSGYSIGCTRFDRQKNRLKELSLEHEWLTIADGSNRLVMTIDGAPFRFTRDDYLAPKKRTSTAVSDVEAIQIKKFGQKQFELGLEPNKNLDENSNKPVKWRFFVDVTENPESRERDYEIFFVGHSEIDEICCVWQLSDHKSLAISSADEERPETVKTQPAKTTLLGTEKPQKSSKEE